MRPKDEDGKLMLPPHKRLENANAMEAAAIFAIAQDGRSVALPYNRKLAMVRKCIDHCIDGDKMPKWVSKKDPDRPDNHALLDMWRAAEVAIRKESRA
jgi:hypothetical protein